MPYSLGNHGARSALILLWLISFLSNQVLAVPIWRATAVIAHANKNLGCTYGCNFDLPQSNSTDFFLTSNNGEPIQLPELSAGHFLVIPVAAFAAIGYHVFKLRSGKPL